MILRPKAPNNTTKCEHVATKGKWAVKRRPGRLVPRAPRRGWGAAPFPRRGAKAARECRPRGRAAAAIHTPARRLLLVTGNVLLASPASDFWFSFRDGSAAALCRSSFLTFFFLESSPEHHSSRSPCTEQDSAGQAVRPLGGFCQSLGATASPGRAWGS